MGASIIWKPQALRQLREIQRDIRDEFGKTTLDKFLDDLFNVTLRLEEQPDFGRQTLVKGVRRIKVYKKTSLFYRIQKGNVVIHRAADVRQNLGKY